MAQVIARHNKKTMAEYQPKPDVIKPDKLCDCNKSNLPCIMDGTCVEGNVIYGGAVTRQDTGKTDYYTGLSWKLRWNNHKANFKTNTKASRTATCLSKHIWNLKDKNIPYIIKFKQLGKASSFNPVTNIC